MTPGKTSTNRHLLFSGVYPPNSPCQNTDYRGKTAHVERFSAAFLEKDAAGKLIFSQRSKKNQHYTLVYPVTLEKFRGPPKRFVWYLYINLNAKISLVAGDMLRTKLMFGPTTTKTPGIGDHGDGNPHVQVLC